LLTRHHQSNIYANPNIFLQLLKQGNWTGRKRKASRLTRPISSS